MPTLEEVYKAANEELAKNVRAKIVLNKVAARGFTLDTQEKVAAVMERADVVGAGLATGEIDPIPMSQLESDGTLSKHASARIQEDGLAFADQVNLDVEQLAKDEPAVYKQAAVIALGAIASQL